jgi:hypothetical protein
MRLPLLAASLFALHAAAFAGCVGSPSFYTCTDDTGNTYTVSKMGNMTSVTGSNPSTGSQWNQQSSQLGNSTFVTGQTNGRNWNNTITTTGGTTTQSGIDSQGRPFFKTCTAAGCY